MRCIIIILNSIIKWQEQMKKNIIMCFVIITVFFNLSLAENVVWPTDNETLTSTYGPRHMGYDANGSTKTDFHNGIDIRTIILNQSTGNPLFTTAKCYAVRPLKITDIRNSNSLGYYVVINNSYRYGHLSGTFVTNYILYPEVTAYEISRNTSSNKYEIVFTINGEQKTYKKNDQLALGEFFAITGNSGQSAGPHLHFDLGNASGHFHANPMVMFEQPGHEIATRVSGVPKAKIEPTPIPALSNLPYILTPSSAGTHMYTFRALAENPEWDTNNINMKLYHKGNPSNILKKLNINFTEQSKKGNQRFT